MHPLLVHDHLVAAVSIDVGIGARLLSELALTSLLVVLSGRFPSPCFSSLRPLLFILGFLELLLFGSVLVILLELSRIRPLEAGLDAIREDDVKRRRQWLDIALRHQRVGRGKILAVGGHDGGVYFGDPHLF